MHSVKLIRFDHSDNTRNECRGLIDNLKKAWALVGQKLAHHSKSLRKIFNNTHLHIICCSELNFNYYLVLMQRRISVIHIHALIY